MRDYEVDYQGIVNNANYFHYFDHARAVYLKKVFNINVKKYADCDVKIILMKTEILFKYSLTFGESFYVLSEFSRVSRFKFKFDQKLYLERDNKICATSNSLIAAIKGNGEPHLMQEFCDV